ncbi:MAG TPA: addiction module protein [Thermoanaerobaculia bacterium]|nr:addiction module protein [Thermoanaerobaculia bacterium]
MNKPDQIRDAVRSVEPIDEVREAAMALSPEQRAQLAGELYDSLLTDEEREIQREWDDEALRRLEEYRAGRMNAIPAEEVFARLEAKYGSARRRSARSR